MIMRIIDIDNNTLSWAPRGQIIAILYKDKAICLLPGLLPKQFSSGIYLQIASSARPQEHHDYEYIGYGFRLLPALTGAVCQWPRWYSWIWQKLSWRNYDVCGVLKSAIKLAP